MKTEVLQLSKVGKTKKPKRLSPNYHKYEEVRTREYLFQEEVEAILSTTKKSSAHHGHRNYTLILLIYRHGLRLSEAYSLVINDYADMI